MARYVGDCNPALSAASMGAAGKEALTGGTKYPEDEIDVGRLLSL